MSDEVPEQYRSHRKMARHKHVKAAYENPHAHKHAEPEKDYLKRIEAPQWVNGLIEATLHSRPDKFDEFAQDYVQHHFREVGKGPHAQKMLKYGQEGPAYTQNDPRVTPSSKKIIPESVYMKPHRSVIEPVEQRPSYSTTVGLLYQQAVDDCTNAVNAVIAECKKSGKKFFDQSFYFDSRRTMYPKGSPPDCTVSEPTLAQRACDLFHKAPLFSDSVGANDIIQGQIGDCFFIGAVSALASSTAQHLNPIGRLFPAYSEEHSVFGVLFFKDGNWEWVLVDDYVAVCKDESGNTVPQYACPGSVPELWPMLLEKAYAKVHFNWDTIDGGWLREALSDMTGGLEYAIDLYKAQCNMSFDQFKNIADDPMTILGCAVGAHVQSGGGSGHAGEQGAVNGLFHGHAYSVLAVVKTSDGRGFVRVRNPWGNDAEWTGAYADNSADWKRDTIAMKELKPEFKADGAFWMKWEDFKRVMTDVDVCRYFEDHWIILSFFNQSPKNDMVDNNVFIIEVGSDTDAVISLSQRDPKTNADHAIQKGTWYKAMRLSIYRLNKIPTTITDITSTKEEKFDTPKDKVRNLDHNLKLKKGVYSLLPQFSDASGISYMIRVFAQPDSQVVMYRFDDRDRKANLLNSANHSTLASDRGDGAAAGPAPTPVVPAPNPYTPPYVPPYVPSPIQPTPAPTPQPRPQPAPTPTPPSGSDDAAAAALGVSVGDLQGLIKSAYDNVDKYRLGRVDVDKADQAIMALLTPQSTHDTIKKIFTKYDKYGDGRLRQDQYYKFTVDVLATLKK